MNELDLSITEENYLKAIYKLADLAPGPVSTNAIAQEVQISAASVSDMLRRLSEKELIVYEKYKGVRLNPQGKQQALALIRKHRLWETFLVEKLDFSWDEVHPLAEQLEHIRSIELVDRLDAFLGHPKVDPHGDPIPDAEGNFHVLEHIILAELKEGQCARIVGVKEDDADFLRYLEELGLQLGVELQLIKHFSFDGSLLVQKKNGPQLQLSKKLGQHLFVRLC